MDVRRRTHLERYASVAHERRQPAELDRPVVADRDVVDDAHAVAEPLGAAPLECLPDGRKAERLAGVDRDVEVLATDVLERVQVAGRSIAGLGPGDVKTHDPGVPPADRAFG